MNKEPLEIFQTLNQDHRLVKQEPEKNTCVAVVYLNLAIYLGKDPLYSADEVKEMLDAEKISWERNVFPKLAGEGVILKSCTFKSYADWLFTLSKLVNDDKIPVGLSIITSDSTRHAIIALKVIKDESNILIAYDPLRGFIELKITEDKLLLNNRPDEIFFHHSNFHIYYP